MRPILRERALQRIAAVAFRYGVPMVSTAVALSLTRWLDLSVFPTPLFFAAIVASPWYAGAVSVLLAIVFATLTLDYYLLPATQTMFTAVPHLLQFSLPALLTLERRRSHERSGGLQARVADYIRFQRRGCGRHQRS